MTNRNNFYQTFMATAAIVFLMLSGPTAIHATGRDSLQSSDTTAIPVVEVIAKDNRKLFRKIPGTVHVVGKKELDQIAPLSAADVMRKVPGLHVNDEDPAGLRLNIGVRGLNPQRSTRVLVLEDGIPFTLNPYGESQMYYSPMIDRMEGVEVLKSSGQILFGPQTIGGVVNFITANPPDRLTNRIKMSGGSGGFFSGYASHGNSVGNAGYIVNYLHKRADGLGPLRFKVNDANAKFHYRISGRSRIGFKIGFYNEQSNSTYIGMTQSMYDKGGWDQTALAQNDLMLLDRYSASITHNYAINRNVELQTNAFAYYIRRNWRRQDFDRKRDPDRTYERILGDGQDGSSVFFRETSLWRNRQYVVKGLEPRLKIDHTLFSVPITLKTGVRVLWETAYEQAIRTVVPQGFNGQSSNNEERNGIATSGYALNEFRFSDRFSASLGLRLENYKMVRQIFEATDGKENISHDRSVFAIIPGGGVNFSVSDNLTLFAGVHKGFAPPVIKNAINKSGRVDAIDKEESVNFDIGGRLSVGNYLTLSPSLFYIDFSNQVIPVTLATAGSGFANGGESKHKGAEFAFEYDLAKSFGSVNSVIIGGTFTYTDARFAGEGITISDKGEQVQHVRNNLLPYSPKVIFNNFITVDLASGLGARVSGNYVGRQFTESNNISTPSPSGEIGAISSRYIVDANLFYTFRKKYSVNISAKNLTGQRSILTRHAQGIRVVPERFISMGVDISF